MKTQAFWLIGAAIAALLLAMIGTTPPQFVQTESGNEAVPSSARAFAHVERIAAKPHVTGSEENAEVRQYLLRELVRMGFAPQTTSGAIDERSQAKLDRWRGFAADGRAQFVNVIGVLEGSEPGLPAVALMAHYDSVWKSPGASDDAAGVASILETARAISARGQPRRTLVLVLTDAEELGLVGARQFFETNPLAGDIGAIVNLEARGGGGIASMFQTSAGNGEVARFYADNVAHPATSSLSTFVYSVLPNDTDLTAAIDRGGYAAWNIAFIGRPGLYHSPLATPENLDRGSLEHMLGQTYELATALLESDVLPQEAADAVFFDVFGLFVAIFPAWLGWLFLLVTAAAFAAAYWRGHGTGGSLARGAGAMAAFLLGTGLLLYGLNIASGAGTGAGYYDRLAAIPKLTVMALLTVMGVFAVIFGPGASALRTRIGAAIPLIVLGIAAQTVAPTAAYVIVVPVMLIAVGELGRAILPPIAANLVCAAAAAVVTGYMLAIGWQIMQGVGPSMPWLAALPGSMAALAILPLWYGQKRVAAAGIVLLIAALGTALWTRFDPVPPTVAAYSPLKPG